MAGVSAAVQTSDGMRRELVSTLFWISLVLTLATLAPLVLIDQHLRSPASPLGIVAFEVCAYAGSCRAIVERWGPGGQVWAALSLGVDYLFMFLYPATIFLGLLRVAERVPGRLKTFTRGAAWAVWGAGAADAAENYCLARMLVGAEAGGYAWPAAAFATIKFVVLGFTLAWWLVTYARCALSRWRDGEDSIRA
jgi:hypothetical protein